MLARAGRIMEQLEGSITPAHKYACALLHDPPARRAEGMSSRLDALEKEVQSEGPGSLGGTSLDLNIGLGPGPGREPHG